MGLLGGTKEITEAFVDSAPLIAKADYTNTRRKYLMSAVVNREESVTKNIIASNLSGWHRAVRNFHRYAINYYAFPPPIGKLGVDTKPPELLALMKELFPGDDTLYIASSFVGSFDFKFWTDYFVKYTFTDAYGNAWDPNAQKLDVIGLDGNTYLGVINEPYTKSTFVDGKLYVDTLFPQVNKPGYYIPDPRPPSGPYPYPPIWVPATNNPPVLVNREYRPDLYTEDGKEIRGTYWHVSVGFNSDPDRFELWIYREETNQYPQLGKPVTEIQERFMSVAIIKRDQDWYYDLGEVAAATTPKLLKKININAEEVVDALKEEEASLPENTNVYDTFINFVLPVGSFQEPKQDPTEDEFLDPIPEQGSVETAGLEYIYEYLTRAYDAEEKNWEEWKKWAWEVGETNINNSSITIGYMGPNYPTGNIPGWNYKSSPRTGTLIEQGGKDAYRAEHTWNFIKRAIAYSDPSDPDKVPSFNFYVRDYYDGMENYSSTYYPKLPPKIVSIKRISNTVWEAYAVFGLRLSYRINTREGYKGIISGVYLPIHENIINTFNSPRSERILQEAAHITMFLIYEEDVKIKWYESNLFKAILVAVTVVVIIVTSQYQFVGMMTAIFGGYTYLALLVTKFVIGFLISYTAQLLIGGPLGSLIAVAATYYFTAGVGGPMVGPVQPTPTFTFGNVISFTKSVSDIYMAYEQEQVLDRQQSLEEEKADWLRTYKEQQEALEAAYYNTFGYDNSYSPLEFTRQTSNEFMEIPDAFYHRTLNNNAGVDSLDMIRQFHEVCLQLPKDVNYRNPAIALNFGEGYESF